MRSSPWLEDSVFLVISSPSVNPLILISFPNDFLFCHSEGVKMRKVPKGFPRDVDIAFDTSDRVTLTSKAFYDSG